jgi:hypothetical protein
MSEAHAAHAAHPAEEGGISKAWKMAALVVVGGAAILAALYVSIGVYLPMITDIFNGGVSSLMRLKVLSMLIVGLLIAIIAPPAILYFGSKWAFEK